MKPTAKNPIKEVPQVVQSVEWMNAETIALLPQWHSDAQTTKPILLAFKPRAGHPTRVCLGRFVAGLIWEFYCEGSPSSCKPDAWTSVPLAPWDTLENQN
jgi:hypothetical protein